MSYKLPWMKFYPADWLQDTTPLSLAGRGAWITIICAMWRTKNRGKLSLPMDGLIRLLGSTESETTTVIDELKFKRICNAVTDHDKNVTLVCRRIIREEKHRNGNALRQRRYRVTHDSNANITGKKQIQMQISDAEADKNKIARTDKPSVPESKLSIAGTEWLSTLKPDCEKQGINLDDQIIKMRRWLTLHPGRKMTQRFVVNWVNKCDKTVQTASTRMIFKPDPRRELERHTREIVLFIRAARTSALKPSDFTDALAALHDKYRDAQEALRAAFEIEGIPHPIPAQVDEVVCER